ncbi:MAG: hypothetical protein V4449_01105 [Patescibacteria group bacterium]
MEGSTHRLVSFGRSFVVSKGADVKHRGMKRLPEDRSVQGQDGSADRHNRTRLRGKRVRFDPNAPFPTLM